MWNLKRNIFGHIGMPESMKNVKMGKIGGRTEGVLPYFGIIGDRH